MRENAAVTGGADNHRGGPASLLPMAAVAVAVLIVALVVASGRTGTIVVQRIMFLARSSQNPPMRYSVTSITEASAEGTDEGDFEANTFGRPGYQGVATGQTVQLYDPHDNTIYVTTLSAEARALDQEFDVPTAKGSHVRAHASVQRVSSRGVFIPGRESVYERELRAHQYSVAGRAMIDGHAALRLVQSRASRLGLDGGGISLSLTTVFVSPRSYDPIEAVVQVKLPGIESTTVERWQVYRVLPATSANQRLLSLAARHPHARIVDSGRAYLRATQTQVRTVSRRVNTG